MRHIFISTPFRSGSALTSRMLNAHSLVGMTVDKLTNKISKNSVLMVSCQNYICLEILPNKTLKHDHTVLGVHIGVHIGVYQPCPRFFIR